MSQSLAKVLVHTVFSTKERRPLLHSRELRDELHKYLGGVLANPHRSVAFHAALN